MEHSPAVAETTHTHMGPQPPEEGVKHRNNSCLGSSSCVQQDFTNDSEWGQVDASIMRFFQQNAGDVYLTGEHCFNMFCNIHGLHFCVKDGMRPTFGVVIKDAQPTNILLMNMAFKMVTHLATEFQNPSGFSPDITCSDRGILWVVDQFRNVCVTMVVCQDAQIMSTGGACGLVESLESMSARISNGNDVGFLYPDFVVSRLLIARQLFHFTSNPPGSPDLSLVKKQHKGDELNQAVIQATEKTRKEAKEETHVMFEELQKKLEQAQEEHKAREKLSGEEHKAFIDRINTHHDQELVKAEESHGALQGSHDALRGRFDELRESRDALQGRLSESQESCDSLRKKLGNVPASAASAKDFWTQRAQAQLQQQRLEMERTATKLRDEIKQLRVVSQRASSENGRMGSLIDGLRKSLEGQTALKRDVEQKLSKATDELGSYKKEISAELGGLREKQINCTKAHDGYRRSMEEMVVSLKDQICQFKQEKISLIADLHSSRVRSQDLIGVSGRVAESCMEKMIRARAEAHQKLPQKNPPTTTMTLEDIFFPSQRTERRLYTATTKSDCEIAERDGATHHPSVPDTAIIANLQKKHQELLQQHETLQGKHRDLQTLFETLKAKFSQKIRWPSNMDKKSKEILRILGAYDAHIKEHTECPYRFADSVETPKKECVVGRPVLAPPPENLQALTPDDSDILAFASKNDVQSTVSAGLQHLKDAPSTVPFDFSKDRDVVISSGFPYFLWGEDLDGVFAKLRKTITQTVDVHLKSIEKAAKENHEYAFENMGTGQHCLVIGKFDIGAVTMCLSKT
jgi:predicted  nucleic acid-binding Zn-ribbon protein